MTPRRAILNPLRVLSPWLTLAVLAGMAHWLPSRAEFDESAQARKAEVASAVQRVPLFIGDWVGKGWDEIPREAQQLLRPNAVMGRTYSRLGGPSLNILVVHCGDARDMLGHYPPVCYPNAGWLEVEPEEGADTTVKAGGVELPVRAYRFRRIREHGQEDAIRILNTFILPDGSVTRDKDDVNRQSERLAVSVQGVAQVQIMVAAAMPLDEARRNAGELLGGMGVLFDALGVGKAAGRGRGEQQGVGP